MKLFKCNTCTNYVDHELDPNALEARVNFNEICQPPLPPNFYNVHVIRNLFINSYGYESYYFIEIGPYRLYIYLNTNVFPPTIFDIVISENLVRSSYNVQLITNNVYSVLLKIPQQGSQSTQLSDYDEYYIVLDFECGGNNGINITVTRQPMSTLILTEKTDFSPNELLITNNNVQVPSVRIPRQRSINNCDNGQVPRIRILGQRTVDNQYISEMNFTIYDNITYYQEEPLPKTSKCSINFISSNELKETIFKQCTIPLETVLRGTGTTLFDKVVSLYDEKCYPSFLEFYNNLILYGLSKYILARVLYGRFNLKYLLQKYNEKFLRDLGHGRFCQFLNAFEDCRSEIYGYGKFFK